MTHLKVQKNGKKILKINNLCPGVSGRYFKNVKNVESPKWLQERLTAIGIASNFSFS